MKICVFTLGCKVNFYESDSLINELNKLGYETTNKLEYADIYILNTCCVTNEGERKSRQLISRCKNFNEKAKILVCGCASQKNPEQFKEKNVNVIIGNANKAEIIDKINEENYKQLSELPLCYVDNLHSASQRVRAYLKVQDGCNNFCSYCIIPYVRGRSRSRDLKSVLLEVQDLSKNCAEIVLTGINLSDYKPSLIELIENLKDVPSRLRLGSLEVNVITDDFMQRLVKIKNFCPQFHLSLQSGSNSVLKKMNRHYTKEEYLEKIDLIRKYYPYASITTDLIVGFPTETDECFLESLQTVKKAEFFMVHCFPYSKREGTVASKMPQILNKVKKERLKQVENVASNLHDKFILKLKENNVEQNLLIEEKVTIDGIEYYVGHTEYFVKCYLKNNNKFKENDIVKVKILEKFNDGVKVL